MRPPRIAVLVFLLASSFFLIGRALTYNKPHRPSHAAPENLESEQKSSLWDFMYYNTPFSLFPPNAAISLTDDNSTSFAARPAAFGPKLVPRGLSGQLWVGDGFADDELEANGEFGCSDLPTQGAAGIMRNTKTLRAVTVPRVASSSRVTSRRERSSGISMLLDHDNRAAIAHARPELESKARDGSHDKLHEGLTEVPSHQTPGPAKIENLPEAADIEGKIVLLMRGGCGFLEKVMWAQRRGAVAVIVGDNTKGGPLIQMFAHGEDVDNVTIPSVFTARTTAQLLSSLTQPGNFVEDMLDDNGDLVFKVQHKAEPGGKSDFGDAFQDRVDAMSRRVSTPRKRGVSSSVPGSDQPVQSWLSRLVFWRQSPSSSRRDATGWELVGDWSDEKDRVIHESMGKGETKDSTTPYRGVGPKTSPSHARRSSLPTSDTHGSKSHAGLWVTITPTNSASPFFDTLLVLVVSPLVTLTVVYALLIIRAKIRRRRWRAPKSVVEQLPVRTYHTVAGSTAPATRQPSPASSSPATPLLQSSLLSRQRSRANTTTSEGHDAAQPTLAIPAEPPSETNQGHGRIEGAGGFSAEWKKYMGRQVECVVCLEEYVDGVSRVMSLPCGHEFHADCITPWLTTRRRTCPICKGDVVRSLARGSPSNPHYEAYRDDSDDEDNAEASGTRPVDQTPDLEQGILAEPSDSRQEDNWLAFWPNSFGSRTRPQSPPRPEDHNRL